MVDGTAPATWQNGAELRRALGMLLRIGAFFALVAVLFLGPLASEAQAHGVHAGLAVQMPTDQGESTVSQDKAEAVGAQTGCGVNCCSATGCAAAVLNAAHPGIVVVAIDNRFALPGHTAPRPSPQSTLKRPPRA